MICLGKRQPHFVSLLFWKRAMQVKDLPLWSCAFLWFPRSRLCSHIFIPWRPGCCDAPSGANILPPLSDPLQNMCFISTDAPLGGGDGDERGLRGPRPTSKRIYRPGKICALELRVTSIRLVLPRTRRTGHRFFLQSPVRNAKNKLELWVFTETFYAITMQTMKDSTKIGKSDQSNANRGLAAIRWF